MKGPPDFDDKPPDDPPKFIYHGLKPQFMPEEIRRIFGTPPKVKSKPIPPPPPPPNTYHKKPKYWQMRGTGHMTVPNRMAGVVTSVFVAISYILFKYNTSPTRWGDRFGVITDPDLLEEERLKNELWIKIFTNVPEDQFETNLSGDKYYNPRRKDAKIRWDLREIDTRIHGAHTMQNPDQVYPF